ncbi:Cytochrome C assembly protein [Corchorus olitorius]|uniref:Cytochrome C assembly protein n=1 Tax=Corchorus olitorius TaxID=93759 RepID=A0A1R3G599_9ROSI|nr:Cytochrome C assembly protein [Corchorus olitorius]
MERKIPLLRLFVGPPARTQWSLTKTRNQFEFGS